MQIVPAKSSSAALAVDQAVASQPVPVAQPKSAPVAEVDSTPVAEVESTPVAEIQSTFEAVQQQEVELSEPSVKKIALQDFNPSNWIELRSQLNIGASLGEIASHCLYLGRQENQLQFMIDSDQTSLYDAAHQQSLGEALSDYFDQQISVEISFGVAEQETPRAADLRQKAERLADAVETLNSDPAVIKFKQLFEGSLDEKSVRPID